MIGIDAAQRTGVLTARQFQSIQVISYESPRITMETAKGEPTVSYLLIRDADLADSGLYSCSPSNTAVASIRVHVLNGK